MPPESVVRWSLHPRLLTPLANVNVNARSMPATTCRGQGNSPRQSEIPALVEHGLREGGHERVPAEGGGEGVSPREFGVGGGCTGSESSKCGGPGASTGQRGRARLPRGWAEGQVTREPVGRGRRCSLAWGRAAELALGVPGV